ncbi:uncharacterized protein CBL_13561 [Carabus blaptoides fortunei]
MSDVNSKNEKNEPKKMTVNDSKLIPPGKLIGIRHIQSLMLFMCLMLGYAFRVNMSIAIVQMVDNTSNKAFPAYDWDKATQGLVHSSFFWGYVISQIPAGQLGAMYGPKYLLVASMFLNSIFCIMTAFMADIGGAWAVIGCRIAQGLCQGFFFPSIHNLLAKWIPPSERGRLGTFVYAGAQFGTVIAMPVSGYLAESSIGWPSIFFVFGAAGIIWSVAWYLLGANDPSDHSSISQEEKKYIESSLGVAPEEKRVPTPWIAMLTSLPMWALTIAHLGQNWGFWTLLTQMPTYMKNVLHFDIKENGVLSALPYLVMWLMSFVFSAVSDYIINNKILSVVVARKIGNTIGTWIPAVALISLGYITSEQTEVAVSLLTIAVGINSAVYVGFQVNHIDLAPKHAGTMMGITNAAANVFSIIGPIVGGLIVTDESDDVVPWRIVFFISSGIYFFFNLFFIIFGKAEVQPWNDIEEKPDAESPRYSTNQESDRY